MDCEELSRTDTEDIRVSLRRSQTLAPWEIEEMSRHSGSSQGGGQTAKLSSDNKFLIPMQEALAPTPVMPSQQPGRGPQGQGYAVEAQVVRCACDWSLGIENSALSISRRLTFVFFA